MDLTAWKAQLRKGAAELAVLVALAKGESYGLALLEQINEAGGLELSEGSIYPLLNRLQTEGKIRAWWSQDEGASHPRKYYALTEEGRALKNAMLAEWAQFQSRMEQLLSPLLSLETKE